MKNAKNVILSSFSPVTRDRGKKVEELEETKRVLIKERLAIFSSPLIRYIKIFRVEYWLAPVCSALQCLESINHSFWGWYGKVYLLASKLFFGGAFGSTTEKLGRAKGGHAILGFSQGQSAAYRFIEVDFWNKNNWKRKVSDQSIRSVVVDLDTFSALDSKEGNIELLKSIFHSVEKSGKKVVLLGSSKDFQYVDSLNINSKGMLRVEEDYFNQLEQNPILGWEPEWINRRGSNESERISVRWKKREKKKALNFQAGLEKERHEIYREAMSNFSKFQILNRMFNPAEKGNINARWAPAVSVVAVTRRPEYLEQLLKSFEVQAHSNKELILILNDDCWKTSWVKERTKNIPNVIVDDTCLRESLGVCLNRGFELSSGEFVAKFDDDDFYGSQYLSDQLLVFTFSNADIVGKHSFFFYDSRLNFTGLKYPGMEFKRTYFLKGGTLLFRKEVGKKTQFRDLGWRQSGEDTYFLKDCSKKGCELISSDPFNFIFKRHSDLSMHTFTCPDARFLSNSVYFTDGLALGDVLI